MVNASLRLYGNGLRDGWAGGMGWRRMAVGAKPRAGGPSGVALRCGCGAAGSWTALLCACACATHVDGGRGRRPRQLLGVCGRVQRAGLGQQRTRASGVDRMCEEAAHPWGLGPGEARAGRPVCADW